MIWASPNHQSFNLFVEEVMDCIVTAGGTPKEGGLLYSYTQGKSKALLDMNGRTMLERVVDALQTARQVDDIVIVGLGSDMGQQFKRPVAHIPDQGSLVSNVLAGVAWAVKHKPDAKTVLISSADIPLLTAEMVDEYIDMCRPFDQGMYYNFVTRETMEARFPGSNRTFTRLKDGEIAGGDISLVQPPFVDGNEALWETLAAGRKQAWKLARAVGLRVLLKLLTHRLAISDIETLAERITNHPIKIILNPYAEIAMDGDKPHQIDILRAEMKNDEL